MHQILNQKKGLKETVPESYYTLCLFVHPGKENTCTITLILQHQKHPKENKISMQFNQLLKIAVPNAVLTYTSQRIVPYMCTIK